MKVFRIQQLVSLITAFLIMVAVAINRDGRFLGQSIVGEEPVFEKSVNDSITADGTWVISTRYLAKDIIGYAGNIPLQVYLKEGRVVKVEVLDNSETPSFMESVLESGLLNQWNNLTSEEVIEKQVDVVSGATFTSNAIIKSVQVAANYSLENPNPVEMDVFKPDLKLVVVLLVVVAGILLPILIKSKKYRYIQLVLNVIVLGFWSGSFISISLITNYLSNGLNWLTSIIPILLLISAFVLPLLGRPGHYCNWLCPMGSIQELSGKILPYKLKMPDIIVKILYYFREGLWFDMMLLMWIGIGFEVMDYEVFSAFLFQTASIPVLIIGGVFLVLSVFIPKPYCRFVCPTGTLMKFAQKK